MAENTRISREDLEGKFRALQADIQGRAADKKQSAIAIGSAAASIIVLLAYLFGRRRGRRRASRVDFAGSKTYEFCGPFRRTSNLS